MINCRVFLSKLLMALGLILAVPVAVYAQDSLLEVNPGDIAKTHDLVRNSLVLLRSSGTPQKGPLAGNPDAVASQGTGFIVSAEGFLLTTAHLFEPLEEVDAVQIKTKAQIGGNDSRLLDVDFVSSLPQFDMVVLKIRLPTDHGDPPPPLEIGYSSEYNPAHPQVLMTSGFEQVNNTEVDYSKKELSLISREGKELAYGWTLNGKTPSGLSGSPVYILREVDGDRIPYVIGMIKATSSGNDERSHMIPIEYGMPLIGHLQMRRLDEKVAYLLSMLGKIEQGEPPMNVRLKGIEGNLTEIGEKFTWTARTEANGSLIIEYHKLISGGPQVERIALQAAPWVQVDGANQRPQRQLQSPIRRLMNSSNAESIELSNVQRTNLDATKTIGSFVLRGFQQGLETQAKLVVSPEALDNPIPRLDLVIIPYVSEDPLPSVEIVLEPDYPWSLP